MLPSPLTVLKFLLRAALLSVIFLYFLTWNAPTNAGCTDYFSCNAEIERVKKEITRLKGEEKTLANQISYLDNQIYLTELEIQAKQQEIDILSVDIGDLTVRLDRIGSFLTYQEEIFANRARLAYASDQLSSFDVVLGAENLDDAMRRIKYLRVLENQDIQVLNEMRDTRTSFNDQKTVLEGKKADVERLKKEVEAEKVSLISQQNAKEQLLEETKGQEARYQEMLKLLEAERQAILAALRRGGTNLGPVTNLNSKLTNQGNTGCSTGPHIHYAVGRGPVGNSQVDYFVNPCSYVGVSGGTCDSSGWGYGVAGGTVVNGSYQSPGKSNNYLTQSYWQRHLALDLVSRDYNVYPSATGNAYLVQDTSWRSWCPSWIKGGGYDGPAYGIVIDHGNGLKTIYWHIQP